MNLNFVKYDKGENNCRNGWSLAALIQQEGESSWGKKPGHCQEEVGPDGAAGQTVWNTCTGRPQLDRVVHVLCGHGQRSVPMRIDSNLR